MRLNRKLSLFLLLTAFAISGCDRAGDRDQLRVTQYSGPEFTESDIHAEWTAAIEDGTVTLQAIPEQSSNTRTFVVTFEDRPGRLPSLLDVWFGPYGGGIGRRLENVTVEIQNWDLDGEISGAIAARHPSGEKSYDRFWLSLSEE